MDKWYIEDRLKLPYGKVNKPCHDDQGEGYDLYEVGDTRGCGGISVWADGKLHNSDTFIAHRMIENTPERVAFKLDYASDFNGKTLRETKRITLIMGQRLFQSDSRFTLDGKPAANLEVAIGLAPQVKDSKPVFSPKTGAMMIWEKFDGLGTGTGVVIDPSRVVKMTNHTDAAGQTQALCLARTDADGHIRWFSGFGWEGQGEITTAEKWTAYLKSFAGKFVKDPFATPSFEVHNLPIPAETPPPAPKSE
jgi:hypothetical protein